MTKPKDGDWRKDAGYFVLLKTPCCVCGSKESIGMEPRFNYCVCEKHSKLSPVQVSEQRKEDDNWN